MKQDVGAVGLSIVTRKLEYSMNALKCKVVFALLLAIGVGSNASGASKDVDALLDLMPGDLPLAAIIPNALEFDARLAEAMKQLDPDAESPGLVSELKRRVKLADWVDFSKPLGLAQSDFSNDQTALIFAVSPNFGEKVKALENAKEEDGVWRLPFDENTTVFAVQKGAYVIASKSKESLQAALNATSKLGDNIKNRISLLDGKQIFLEVNFEPLRATALGAIMQLSAIAPMLAMSAASDGSVDPAAISGLISAGTGGLQKFVEQVAFVDIALGIVDGALNVTVQPTFNEGVISQYLAAQKSGTDFFKGMSTDSYIAALSWQFPGNRAPLFDYLFTKMEAAAAAPSPMMMMMGQPPAGGDQKAAAEAKLKAVKESLAAARKVTAATQSANAVFFASSPGMQITGDYRGGSPSELLQLLSESLVKSNPLSSMFGLGATYQESGSRKIGDVEVKEFAIVLDPNKPQTAKVTAVYGANARFTMGVVGDRVRFCLGSEDFANTFFKAQGGGAMDSGIEKLLKNLPAKKNLVVAFNSSGIMAMAQSMLGGATNTVPAATATPTATPPMGLSISLSGEARLDMHIPLASLKPLVGSGGGGDGGPM